LAFVYALGLGLPLTVVAVLLRRTDGRRQGRFWQALKGRAFEVRLFGRALHLHTTNLFSGLLLIAVGALLATGTLYTLTQAAVNSDLGRWIVEAEETIGRVFGLQ
jgi:hypothetical protein